MEPKNESTFLGKRPACPATDDDQHLSVDHAKKPRVHGETHKYLSAISGTPVKDGPFPSPLTNPTSAEEYQAAVDDGRHGPGAVTPPSSDATRLDLTPSHQAPPTASTEAGAGAQPRARESYYGAGESQTQTQPFSQIIYPPPELPYEVEDEEKDSVWGYLVPLDDNSGEVLVLRDRQSCPSPITGRIYDNESVDPNKYVKQEKGYEAHKAGDKELPSRGYLLGRHPECDRVIEAPTVSNRHCLIFSENRSGSTVAVLEDTSGNGTFINDALVGRNNRRELHDGDEICLLSEARFVFRYARHRNSSAFSQQYTILDRLGKGHFATVYLCVDKATGSQWAVKKFDKKGKGEKSKVEGLQQEIAVLMSVSHPSLLCLKGAFHEDDGVYLILELAPEGELFNWIVMHRKLSESDTRKVFIQLFQAIKYLHERNIVHRDIKPENILLTSRNLDIKLADFGLAKIIGEESFTTTLCGTPSYVAPEILQRSDRRRYTRAVDIWSLGVVLYICLCGFPPFSDELCTPGNPYTLAQQILGGRHDYPSPYWDSVGDPALDLIDRMLTVDPDRRITVDECLEHPWTTGHEIPPTQSFDTHLAGKMTGLEVLPLPQERKRGPVRERTLLCQLNNVRVSKIVRAEVPKQRQGQEQNGEGGESGQESEEGDCGRPCGENDGDGSDVTATQCSQSQQVQNATPDIKVFEKNVKSSGTPAVGGGARNGESRYEDQSLAKGELAAVGGGWDPNGGRRERMEGGAGNGVDAVAGAEQEEGIPPEGERFLAMGGKGDGTLYPSGVGTGMGVGMERFQE